MDRWFGPWGGQTPHWAKRLFGTEFVTFGRPVVSGPRFDQTPEFGLHGTHTKTRNQRVRAHAPRARAYAHVPLLRVACGQGTWCVRTWSFLHVHSLRSTQEPRQRAVCQRPLLRRANTYCRPRGGREGRAFGRRCSWEAAQARAFETHLPGLAASARSSAQAHAPRTSLSPTGGRWLVGRLAECGRGVAPACGRRPRQPESGT